MSLSPEDLVFATELFEALGPITHRKMMGAAALYCDGQIFACLDQDGAIYLRSKGALADSLLAQGCAPFQWTNPKTGKIQTMGYVALPEAALDDPGLACTLAQTALSEG